MTVEKSFDDVVKKNLNKNIGVVPKPSFSFNGFPGDEEIPNEDKLQNSSFLGSKQYVASSSSMIIEKASRDDAKSFHVPNVITPDKNPTTYSPRTEADSSDGTRTVKTSASSSSVNKVESITLKPFTQISESLTQSASNGITNTNARATSKPASSSTVSNNVTSSPSNVNKDKSPAEEVKIFQAPLVAAFTVQQDELGVPKSAVPIYRQSGDGQALTLQEQQSGDGQALTLQEQLDFKQRLLEKQLAELQQQQFQQTQFLVRQRQLYEQQLRQKQQQYYIQEQARIKQLEEQYKIKQLEDQRLKELEEQRLKQLEEQRLYRLHQHNRFPLQKPPIFEQTNVLALQPSLETAVHLQPSLQETFSAIGNFGLNLDNKQSPPSRNAFAFNAPSKTPSTFVYNPYVQFRQIPPRPQTPANQIQRLLYQSGVVGEFGNVQGPGGEDLNIVSKVLALNVGALPNKNYQYTTNVRGKLGSA
ncbi:hypothetical protein X777_14186 [Ooceraea biroi]|uniref:Uncharacterized protein n=1 Tax=Ooceraea biroi TaxID=2015173 RepID=A0A026VWE1_OOCBI|nr:hypothetical protein X777_14186 [Ooceraea biroi]